MSKPTSSSEKETAFALAALMEVPLQYKAAREFGLLGYVLFMLQVCFWFSLLLTWVLLYRAMQVFFSVYLYRVSNWTYLMCSQQCLVQFIYRSVLNSIALWPVLKEADEPSVIIICFRAACTLSIDLTFCVDKYSLSTCKWERRRATGKAKKVVPRPPPVPYTPPAPYNGQAGLPSREASNNSATAQNEQNQVRTIDS